MNTETTLHNSLKNHLKELHLPTIRECYQDTARMAEAEHLSFEQYLLTVTERECETRRTNRIARILRESALPLEKTMVMFDRSRLPHALNAQVTSLLDGSFLDRKENVLAFGKSGSGKSHLLSAIAHELVQKERRVRFTSSSLLVQELLAAKRDLRLARALKRLSRYDLLLIDDIGYVQQNREEMEVLFTLLAERYERGSVMITSNLPFSRWEEIFKDPTTTAAAIDRLVHHSVIIELNLDSYRLEESRKQRKAALETNKTPDLSKSPRGISKAGHLPTPSVHTDDREQSRIKTKGHKNRKATAYPPHQGG
jgi:DNA replication protein DnaC